MQISKKNPKIQKTYKHTKIKSGACYQYKKARQSKNENADKYQKRVKIQKSKKIPPMHQLLNTKNKKELKRQKHKLKNKIGRQLLV